jgi:hypothetical protein
VNQDDISDHQLNRAFTWMASDLGAMVAEAKVAREKIRERQQMRDRNFIECGGSDAFPPHELEAQRREGQRLAIQRERLDRLIDDGHALHGAMKFWGENGTGLQL